MLKKIFAGGTKKVRHPLGPDVKEFLAGADLDAITDALQNLGVVNLNDLSLVTDEDLTAEDVKPIQRRKFFTAFDKWKSTPEYNKWAQPRGNNQSIEEPEYRNISKIKALFDYTAQQPDQLSLVQGEVLLVLDEREMWWVARNSAGLEGKIPPNFVEKISAREQQTYEDVGDDSFTDGGVIVPPVVRRSGSTTPNNLPPALPEEIDQPIYEEEPEQDTYSSIDETKVNSELTRNPHVRDRKLQVVPDSAPLKNNVPQWNCADVKRYLKDSKLDDFCDVFYANGFEGKGLISLSTAAFKSVFKEDRCEVLSAALSRARQLTKDFKNGVEYDVLPPEDKPKEEANPQEDKGMAIVLYDFTATKPKQLSVTKDEELTILDDSSPWWKVRNSVGSIGTVPSNYLQKCEAKPKSSAARPLNAVRSRKEEGTSANSVVAGLDEQLWFHGEIERAKSEELVLKGKAGAFLVRASRTNPGEFTLTAKNGSGILNLRIQRTESNMVVLGEYSSEHSSIVELVDYHQANTIKVQGAHILLSHPIPRE